MPPLTVLVFLLTYAGVAVGRVPGLLLDRTGIALLGAIGMVVTGAVPLQRAVAAIDLPTIALLYALMVISGQLRLAGFYTWAALRIAALLDRPRLFLAASMAVSALLSALLANDIVCLAFTPVLTVSLLNAGLYPVPFLLGLAVASNIGSAATIIGNPQNMLVGQVGRLDFVGFLRYCTPPALLSLVATFAVICWVYRRGMCLSAPRPVDPPGAADWPPLDRWQSAKGLVVVAALLFLFLTPLPRELAGIGAAGVLLCSRRTRSRQVLDLVDWHLITLFCALFVVIEGIQAAGTPAEAVASLAGAGIDLADPGMLTGVSVLLSNLVSNVPATMLLVRFLDPGHPIAWYVLALSSTFAGNLITIGSIANLIVIEQARQYGVRVGFWEHARTGIPVTGLSLGILLAWVYAWH